jgi:hypothetical protein
VVGLTSVKYIIATYVAAALKPSKGRYTMQKMITAVVFASVVALSGVALAAPATPRCTVIGLPELTTPGDVNQYIRENLGSPGQVAKDPLVGLSANEIAALYNTARKTVCPNPS